VSEAAHLNHKSFTLTGYAIRIVPTSIVSSRQQKPRRIPKFLLLPALVLAIAVLAAGLVPSTGSAAGKGPCGTPTTVPRALSLHQMRSSVLCLLNRIRVRHDLHPLAYNQALRTSASAHSVSMVVHGYLAHEGPGGSMDNRILRAGYLASAGRFVIGEDIGGGGGPLGSPQAVVRDWMHSRVHRENILDPHFRDAGVGVARGFPYGGGVRAATYTVDFGARAH
jgi:uncharacterized protein YkwD